MKAFQRNASVFVLSSSLFTVLQRSLRHLRILRQEIREHHHVVLWYAPRVFHHAQFPPGWESAVYHPDET